MKVTFVLSVKEKIIRNYFSELVTEYETFVESKYLRAAEVACQVDMFNEIAHRFFKIVDVFKDKDFCEIMGSEVK